MSAFGLNTYTKEFRFSVTGPDHSELTALDLFMFHLLYQPEIKQQMTLIPLKDVFDQIYTKALQSFQEIIEEKKY